MNLVQINERLKDLPMQVIQQYANGMNPEVPPYLALGELQRRETAQKQMATAQGGMQGPQPSIKEQIEQKAGLMAAQGLQQQQQMQQMQQPRGPMPAPAGIPQPEAQPEMAMARGGLASIPVRSDMFEYAEGGIIAFAKGETVEDPRRERKQDESFSDFRKRMFDLDLQLQRERNAAEQSGREAERQKLLAERGDEIIPPSPFMERPPLPVPGKTSANVTAETMARVGPMTAPSYKDPRISGIGLPDALKKVAPDRAAPPAPSPRPAPALAPVATPNAGLTAAAAPTANPFIEEAAALAREKPVAPTAAGVIEEQKALMPAAMQEEAMQKRIADQRARAEQERSAYEKSRPSGLDELIRVFGQAGQYKGLSGMAPAYTALQQQKRAEDLAMEKRQNELLSAIEGKEYEGAKDIYGARAKTMDAKTAAFENRLTNNAKVLADLGGTTERSITEQLNRTNQMDMTKMRIAADKANAMRPGAGEVLTSQFLAKKAQARDLLAKGDTAGAARVESEANDILTISGKTPTSGNTDRIRGLQTIINSMDASPEEKADAIAQLRNLTRAPEVAKTPITKAEYDKLPKGATYTAPDGTQRTKG